MFFKKQCYYLYVATNEPRTLLLAGVTTSLVKLEKEWKQTRKDVGDFQGAKYLCTKLIYWERFNDINKALKRKKEVEQWTPANLKL